MNFKNITSIYALFFCMITAIILLVATVFLLDNFTDILIPQYKYCSALASFEANNNSSKITANSGYIYRDLKSAKTEKEVEVAKNENSSATIAREEFIAKKKRQAIEGLIRNIQWLGVAAIFFVIHWRLYKKSS